jgi:transposase
MDAHEDTPRIQVLSVSDTGRRRRWTDDEKVRIIEESYRDGASLTDVARRHDVSRSQLYDWRYRYKHGLLGCGPQFLRVVPVADSSCPAGARELQSPIMTIDLGPGCRVSIPSDFDMEAAARLLNTLKVLA